MREKKTVRGNTDEQEKNRKLSEAEQRRLRDFEALSETMLSQGWRRKELTVSIVKANIFAVVLLGRELAQPQPAAVSGAFRGPDRSP